MGNIARRRRRALELLAAQQAAEQLEPEAITQDARIATKGGRPALRDQEWFQLGFASILPALKSGEVSKGEAARRLGVSHRSLNRYLGRST
jgi:hypothetical protein